MSAVAQSSETADLRTSTDQALTEMASEWKTLTPASRRVLLKEMQRRMALNRQGRRAAPQALLQIRTERRFGRRVRQSDGRVVTIETRVVRLRSKPVNPNSVQGVPVQGVPVQEVAVQEVQEPRNSPRTARVVGTPTAAFGVGFERRSAARRIILVPRQPVPANESMQPADPQ